MDSRTKKFFQSASMQVETEELIESGIMKIKFSSLWVLCSAKHTFLMYYPYHLGTCPELEHSMFIEFIWTSASDYHPFSTFIPFYFI